MADLENDDSDNAARFYLTSPQQSVDSVGDHVDHVDPSYKPKVLKVSGTSIGLNEYVEKNQAKILVLYSGGTIGMRSHHGVYEPEPNFLVPMLRRWPMFNDTSHPLVSDSDTEMAPLLMSLSKEGKRIIYCVYEYEPLLDSANMTIDDYGLIANDIKENYESFDGFVVLHGTDTMAYTASALSFMLESLGKPVILTGSQIPIFETRSDGRDNFLGALIMAGHYCIPEVTIYFHNMLLRGNRSCKYDTGSFDAFKSLNMAPLAELEINIKVNWEAIWQPRGMKKFTVHSNMDPNVALLRLFPSITLQTVQAFLHPPMKGVVIQSYGAGNGPDARHDLLALFKQATSSGLLIINITQCGRGMVSTSYATGKALLDAGVIPGSDMTPEAALMKLSYVLGKDWDLDTKRAMMGENLRGEMAVGVRRDLSLHDVSLVEKMAEAMRLSSKEEVESLRDTMFPSLLCAAGKEGNIDALKKLRASGAVFGMTNYDGRSALHVAVCEGHEKTVNYLLEYGSSVHARDRYGHSALDDAIRFSRHEIIKKLMQTGAHLALPPAKLGMMMCNSAIYESVMELESWRLAGGNLNQGDYTGSTALHVAASHGNIELVEYLLSHGAKVNVQDDQGATPIDEARKKHKDKALDLMLSHLDMSPMKKPSEAWSE